MQTPRTRFLPPRGDRVPKPAAPPPPTAIYTLAIRARKSYTTSSSLYPILLSSRPNPNSISQLLKQRYRMARRRAVRGIQLPSPVAQREKIERRRREVREGVRKRPGPKPKLKVRQGEGRALLGGERESPIVIEDSEGEDRPEKAPICFVDDELVEAERVVALEGEGGTSLKRRDEFLGPSRGDAQVGVRTVPAHIFLDSDLGYGDANRPRKRARVEELPGQERTLPNPFSGHRRLADSSPPSNSSAIIQSVETGSTSSADNPVVILDQLKTKVAQLMAIAPGMPISVLYNLLAEMEWDLGRASEAVQRHTSRPSTATPTPVPVAEPDVDVHADVKQDLLVVGASAHDVVAVIDKSYQKDEDILTKLENKDHEFWDDQVEENGEMPFTFQARTKRTVRKPKDKTKVITNNENQTDCTAQDAVKDKHPEEPSEHSASPLPAYTSAFGGNIASTKEVSPFPWEKLAGTNRLQQAQKRPLACEPATITIPRELASPSNSYEPGSPTISLDTHSSYEPPSPSVFANSVAPSLSSNPTSLSSTNRPANLSILIDSNIPFNSFGLVKPPTSHAATRSRQEDPSHLPISTRELSPTNSSSIDLLDSDSDSGGEDEAYMDHLRSGLRLRSKPNETHSS